MKDPLRIGSVVVLRPAGLGDFIMSTPAFVQLRARFPRATITLVTMHSQDPGQAAKVQAYAGSRHAAPWIDLIRPHALDDVRVIPAVRSLRTLRAARLLVADIRPDLVVHMFDPGTPYRRRAMRLAFMAVLFGPVVQIGWRQRGQIHSGRIPATDPHLGHHVQGPLQFLRELDHRTTLSDADVVFDIRPGRAAEQWAEQWLAARALAGKRLIAIAPGAIHDHKQWPLDHFAALIRGLMAQADDAHFVIVGTGKDRALADTLASVAPGRIHDLCGTSSIAQSAAIFRWCALVVGNDGGAMHLADAMGASAVSIVPGLEFPESIEPWHNRDRAVRHPVPCAPCYSFTFCPQGHRRCMLDLPVARVLDQCLRAL